MTSTVLITGANRGIPEQVIIHALEVTGHRQIIAQAEQLPNQPIDILINNAGISGQPGSRIGNIDPEIWMHTFNTYMPPVIFGS